MNPVEIGPLLGETQLSATLDYYKPTMSQAQLEYHPNVEVTFTFKNRGKNRLIEYVDAEDIRTRLGSFAIGWTEAETDELARHERRGGTPLFSEYYLDYLRENELPPVDVRIDGETEDLAIEATGMWPLVTFWETVVMSMVNELYFEGVVRENGLDINEVYEEGNRRLDEKIALMQERPDIKFAEFGTRRRFSYRWQRHVLERLARECPESLIGTSNVQLAAEYNLTPIGTFAHEMPMVYAALNEKSPLEGHRQMLSDWHELYKDNLSTALTDTFGSEYFFTDFTPEQAREWQGLRHDSGDPFDFGEHVIQFYEKHGIDPQEKTIVFSDGLDIEKIIEIADHFEDRVNVVFGWGTTLTNDVGLTPNNIVMKATAVNGVGTVKLSDDEGKHTGAETDVARYIQIVDEHINPQGGQS